MKRKWQRVKLELLDYALHTINSAQRLAEHHAAIKIVNAENRQRAEKEYLMRKNMKKAPVVVNTPVVEEIVTAVVEEEAAMEIINIVESVPAVHESPVVSPFPHKLVGWEPSDKPAFKVVIAGTRTFDNLEMMFKEMDFMLSEKSKTHQIIVFSGKAPGADTLGETYASARNYPVCEFPAQWDRKPDGSYNRAAGPIRNQAMADACDAAVLFWDGESRGTKSMEETMAKLRKPCHVVKYKEGAAKVEVKPVPVVKAPVAAPAPMVAPKAPKTLWAFTDGSWSAAKPHVFGASYVVVEKLGKETKVVSEWSKASKNEDYVGSRNVSGEVYAVIYAMNWAKKNNSPIVICHDYNGISKWCLGEWKVNKPISKLLVDTYKKIPEGLVKFRKVDAHTGNRFNERADVLAKAAVESFVG